MEITRIRSSRLAPSRVFRRLKTLLFHPQLLLAVKVALATGIAWFAALNVPGVAAEFPYYAPLGVVTAMSVTVASTFRQGLQALIGLSLGISLAFVALLIGEPNSFTIAFVVGVGYLMAAVLPRMGSGAHWITTAALFVLLLGGSSAEIYAFGYVLQMLIGVTVGVAASALILPPLNITAADQHITELRKHIAQQLLDMGNAVNEHWPPEDEEWVGRYEHLVRASHEMRAAVDYTQSSRKGNLRRRFYPNGLARNYEYVVALEKVTFQVLNITEVLEDVVWGHDEGSLPEDLVISLRDGLRTVGELLTSWTSDNQGVEELAAAESAIVGLSQQIHRSTPQEKSIIAAAAITSSLSRITNAVGSMLGTQQETPSSTTTSGTGTEVQGN